jgi:zinc transport system substrate-binding protein
MSRICSFIAILFLFGGVFWSERAEAESKPHIVVSIKPLHSLVAAVMEGVAEPELLLSGGETPHRYALRPSQARALSGADAIFWIGPELEGFLVKPLHALGDKGKVVTIVEAPGIELLPGRSGGVWEEHDHHHGHSHGEKKHKHSHKSHPPKEGSDPHLWLDPLNAKAIVRLAALEMGRLFPEHQARFDANAEAMEERLAALDDELSQKLASMKGRPFIVFHDAYHYLERRYNLSAAGAITLSPERSPGAQRLREIRKTIRDRGALCVFAEPQFEPRLVATVVEGTNARQGVLDPLGADLDAGPEAYFTLMRRLEEGLRSCLQDPL